MSSEARSLRAFGLIASAARFLGAGSLMLPAIHFALGGIVESKTHEIPIYIATLLWGAVIVFPFCNPPRNVRYRTAFRSPIA